MKHEAQKLCGATLPALRKKVAREEGHWVGTLKLGLSSCPACIVLFVSLVTALRVGSGFLIGLPKQLLPFHTQG